MPDSEFTFRHRPPPWTRSSKLGRVVAQYRVGSSRSNLSVAPLVHTDGKGVRVFESTRTPSVMRGSLTDDLP